MFIEIVFIYFCGVCFTISGPPGLFTIIEGIFIRPNSFGLLVHCAANKCLNKIH